jgi:hypothetical protein
MPSWLQMVAAAVVAILAIGSTETDEPAEKGQASAPKGHFVTSVGTHTFHDGKITIKVEKVNGKLDTYVRRHGLEGVQQSSHGWGPINPRIKEGASWFIYTEMADEVWWFDGDRHFYLFEEGNGRPGYKRGGVYELDRKSWHIAPKPVVDRLPRAVEGK